MKKDLPANFVKENATLVEAFGAVPMEVMMRFGKWDDILAEPENYPDYMRFTRAFHHGGRAIAFAAKSAPKTHARSSRTSAILSTVFQKKRQSVITQLSLLSRSQII
jgi:hypothetical protein